MADVALQNVTKRFGEITALNDVSFQIEHGEFFVLLGPTGAGKTTTLRVIAGLEQQEAGHVMINEETIDERSPSERDVAFVFQQYSLYPTMTVFDNLAFPLRAPQRRRPESEIRERVEGVTTKLHINHLLERETANLSGGEMQRVALGRAIVRDPQIYLMDEPLSNLDAKLREELRVELQHLQKTQGSTTLFVTHDQVEALTMADRIGVLHDGRIVQVGTPEDIYDRPATTFVAELVGTPGINLLKTNRENGTLYIQDSTIQLPIPDSELPESLQLGVRPEDVQIASDGEYAGEISLIEPLGMETVVYIQAGDQTLTGSIPGMTNFHINENVRFNLLPDRLHYFDSDGNRINVGA